MAEQQKTARSSALFEADRSGSLQLRRYAGLYPYNDHPIDSAFFFGRDGDTRQLANRIRARRSVILFGRSGIGKSSLLKAGAAPLLRQRNFFPFTVRLDAYATDPVASVIRSLSDACARFPHVDLISGDEDLGLWLYFRTTDIWCGSKILTPVIFFDQFEEFFTQHDTEYRQAFSENLRDVVEIGSQRVAERLLEKGAVERLDPHVPVDMRVVFSLREEYLGQLDELATLLPSLFENRMRLNPLRGVDAVQVICEPASMSFATARERIQRFASTVDPAPETVVDQLREAFARSQPFTYSGCKGGGQSEVWGPCGVKSPGSRRAARKDSEPSSEESGALDLLLSVLVNDAGEIDLTMLQTICREQELKVADLRGQQPSPLEQEQPCLINRELLGDKDELLRVWRRFYRNALDATLDSPSPRSNQRRSRHHERRSDVVARVLRFFKRLLPGNQAKASQMFCEDGLISDSGRRVSVDGEVAMNRFGLEPQTLELLENNRIVRGDHRPNLQGIYYELVHDKLAAIIHEERGIRADWRRRVNLLAVSGAIFSILLTLFVVQRYLARERDTGAPPWDEDSFLSDQFVDGTGKGPFLVRIERGNFMMGTSEKEAKKDPKKRSETPQHEVIFSYVYHMTAFEITQDEFSLFVEDNPRSDLEGCFVVEAQGGRWNDEASWRKPGFETTGASRRPVACVNWYTARKFANWLSSKTGHCYELPSESEWENAARGGQPPDHKYPWGKGFSRGEANCGSCIDASGTTSVGKFGANPYGLYDMAGNVAEWVADCWHDGYDDAPGDGSPRGPEGGEGCDFRVLRGGSWLDAGERVRSGSRTKSDPDRRNAKYGFRLVRREEPCDRED